jgi:uncharacterized protein (DUF1778 family)
MPRITKDARITIRLTDDMRDAIEREADRSGRSVASEMVQLIGEALAARKPVKGGRSRG